MVWVYIVIVIAACIFFMVYASQYQDKKREEYQAEIEARKLRLKKEQEAKLKAKAVVYNPLREQRNIENGVPDKIISITPYEIEQDVDVYEKEQMIVLHNKKYKFSDLISCHIQDETRTKKGDLIAKTTTDTGDAVGRAIVGDLFFGEAGAIVGGVTADKTTTIKQSADKVVHSYTIILNVDNITEPVESFCTGNNLQLTNELYGLFNVIISRNKK